MPAVSLSGSCIPSSSVSMILSDAAAHTYTGTYTVPAGVATCAVAIAASGTDAAGNASTGGTASFAIGANTTATTVAPTATTATYGDTSVALSAAVAASALVNEGTVTFTVKRPDGTVLGSVTFARPGSRWAELARPGEAEFRMLGVDPAHRGLGVGAALIEWCLDRARQAGCSSLVMCSMDEMTTAHRLYDRMGFVRRPDLDWVPEPGVLLLGFHRPLP